MHRALDLYLKRITHIKCMPSLSNCFNFVKLTINFFFQVHYLDKRNKLEGHTGANLRSPEDMRSILKFSAGRLFPLRCVEIMPIPMGIGEGDKN